MNNVLSMVNYYLIHKNADDSIVEYIKNKLNDSSVEELIFIQIELLYTDPTDKLVNGLVSFITDKINKEIRDIKLYELSNIINLLESSKKLIEIKISNKTIENETLFSKIKNKDLDEYKNNAEDDNDCAARLINITQDNLFDINNLNSEISSIEIWINNLNNTFLKKIEQSDIEELLTCYTKLVILIDKSNIINKHIELLSKKLDSKLLKSDLLDTITNIMPELNRIYKLNSKDTNSLYKLLDYYIDLLEKKIKLKINDLVYEERLLLKEKISVICKEILENDNPDDDFKVAVINNYMRYL